MLHVCFVRMSMNRLSAFHPDGAMPFLIGFYGGRNPRGGEESGWARQKTEREREFKLQTSSYIYIFIIPRLHTFDMHNCICASITCAVCVQIKYIIFAHKRGRCTWCTHAKGLTHHTNATHILVLLNLIMFRFWWPVFCCAHMWYYLNVRAWALEFHFIYMLIVFGARTCNTIHLM